MNRKGPVTNGVVRYRYLYVTQDRLYLPKWRANSCTLNVERQTNSVRPSLVYCDISHVASHRVIPRSMGVHDTVFYDPHTFRKHFRPIGRAYKEQATTLIGIYRLYVGSPQTQTYTKNDRLQM
jgi:hypothetical protein